MVLQLYRLDPDVALEVEPLPLTYGPEVEREVARVWKERQAMSGGRMFDGPVFGVVGIDPKRLTLRPAQFRHALARCVEPALTATGLDIRQAAVSGLLVCPDGLVLGRRGGGVATEAGLWEPPPSGALDRSDVLGQLLEELREEVGLEASAVARTLIAGAVEEMETGLVDILIVLETGLLFAAIEQAWREGGSDEYTELHAVPLAELRDFQAREAAASTPLLGAMLELAGLA